MKTKKAKAKTKKAAKGVAVQSPDDVLIGVVQAAERLGVSGRTVQMACRRWRLGRRIKVGTLDRVVILLTAAEVEYLDRNLQRRSGRPTGDVETWGGVKK